MTKESKSIVELAEKYLQLTNEQKMFVVGVMQGILLSSNKQQKNQLNSGGSCYERERNLRR